MPAGDSIAAAPELFGTVWSWVRATGPEPLEVERPGRYTLLLDSEGRYAVRADCNNGRGGYALEGNTLALGPAAVTLAECGPASHSARFLQALSRVERLELEGELLTLHLESGAGALELAPSRAVELPGTTWSVRAVNNGREAVVSVLTGTSLHVAFGGDGQPDGQLKGSAGCNSFFADYELEGANLSIGPAGTTRKLCAEPAGVMEQEAALLAALSSVATWELEGERLKLRTDEGALAVDLVSAATDPEPFKD